MSDKFNLQAPISKEVELKLRYKAESLGMNLTQYVRFIVMQDVMNVVVPNGYEPKESKRKPPNAKGRNKAIKNDTNGVSKNSEANTEKKQIPTNQFENKIQITKSTNVNRFAGR